MAPLTSIQPDTMATKMATVTLRLDVLPDGESRPLQEPEIPDVSHSRAPGSPKQGFRIPEISCSE